MRVRSIVNLVVGVASTNSTAGLSRTPGIFDRLRTQPSGGEQVIVAAVAQAVSVVAVEVGERALVAAALEPSSGVTSLRDLGVIHGLSSMYPSLGST